MDRNRLPSTYPADTTPDDQCQTPTTQFEVTTGVVCQVSRPLVSQIPDKYNSCEPMEPEPGQLWQPWQEKRPRTDFPTSTASVRSSVPAHPTNNPKNSHSVQSAVLTYCIQTSNTSHSILSVVAAHPSHGPRPANPSHSPKPAHPIHIPKPAHPIHGPKPVNPVHSLKTSQSPKPSHSLESAVSAHLIQSAKLTHPCHSPKPAHPTHSPKPAHPTHSPKPDRPILKPVHPNQSPKPAHPTHSSKSAHPTHKSDRPILKPVHPNQSPKPAHSSPKPVHPCHSPKPVYPSHNPKPAHPSHHSKPAHPSHHSMPVHPSHHSKPAHPSPKPVHPSPKPVHPSPNPAHSIQSVVPAHSIQSAKPAHPIQSAKPAHSVHSAVPAQPVQLQQSSPTADSSPPHPDTCWSWGDYLLPLEDTEIPGPSSHDAVTVQQLGEHEGKYVDTNGDRADAFYLVLDKAYRYQPFTDVDQLSQDLVLSDIQSKAIRISPHMFSFNLIKPLADNMVRFASFDSGPSVRVKSAVIVNKDLSVDVHVYGCKVPKWHKFWEGLSHRVYNFTELTLILHKLIVLEQRKELGVLAQDKND